MIVSSSGLLEVASKVPDVGMIYYVSGGFMLACAAFPIFGIKDVDRKAQAQKEAVATFAADEE